MHSVVRLGGGTLNDIQRSYNLGTSYTAQIAQIFGQRASRYGLHMHKLIETSFGAPNSVTYSVANMAPTTMRVHQMISAAHSTNIRTLAGQSMTLREYCRYMLSNGHIALEKMHLAQVEIWVLANRLNGAPVPVQQAKGIIDQYATKVP